MTAETKGTGTSTLARIIILVICIAWVILVSWLLNNR
jgi:hypothetical protein